MEEAEKIRYEVEVIYNKLQILKTKENKNKEDIVKIKYYEKLYDKWCFAIDGYEDLIKDCENVKYCINREINQNLSLEKSISEKDNFLERKKILAFLSDIENIIKEKEFYHKQIEDICNNNKSGNIYSSTWVSNYNKSYNEIQLYKNFYKRWISSIWGYERMVWEYNNGLFRTPSELREQDIYEYSQTEHYKKFTKKANKRTWIGLWIGLLFPMFILPAILGMGTGDASSFFVFMFAVAVIITACPIIWVITVWLGGFFGKISAEQQYKPPYSDREMSRVLKNYNKQHNNPSKDIFVATAATFLNGRGLKDKDVLTTDWIKS